MYLSFFLALARDVASQLSLNPGLWNYKAILSIKDYADVVGSVLQLNTSSPAYWPCDLQNSVQHLLSTYRVPTSVEGAEEILIKLTQSSPQEITVQ